MLTSAVTTPINHILHGERWACKRLQSFAEQTVCIQIPPLTSCKLLIDASGEVQPADNNICPDTTLTLSPFILPRLLSQDKSAFELIKVTGNRLLAETLIDIGQHINFSFVFEQDMSKIIGDIPAHRLTQAGEHILRWQSESSHHLAQALAEYWTEENSLLTKSAAIQEFMQAVKNLQTDTEQLELRLNELIQQAKAPQLKNN
ncbi:MAG: hypothetical protein KBC53_11000 [Nitrosomonas sp.]|jgi:ubiquinone biosynthesis protein UbiJ|nr:hypothetical protein [Nitrosomonas sp.]MBP6366782.1 hypothetical protein [Nitrosomonas sp.]MBP9872001.1 hypothetical protein [Nitrosomonas sp.]HQV89283.1 hypothetical protein [Nitrosomonas sp.]